MHLQGVGMAVGGRGEREEVKTVLYSDLLGLQIKVVHGTVEASWALVTSPTELELGCFLVCFTSRSWLGPASSSLFVKCCYCCPGLCDESCGAEQPGVWHSQRKLLGLTLLKPLGCVAGKFLLKRKGYSAEAAGLQLALCR